MQVDEVWKSYRDAGDETHVLRGTTLILPRGALVSLAGVSGSGKSTLLALIAGLMQPDSGHVVVDGEDLTTLDDARRARLRARTVGVVMQSGNLVPFLTAVENVELALRLGGDRASGSRARDLLAEVGLAHRLHHLPRRLSGGEAQRVSAAVALANRPHLLLADEVTGELDSDSAEQLLAVILDAWRERGLTVLFVTHSAELAQRAELRLRLVDGQVRSA